MIKQYDNESRQDITRLFVSGYIEFSSSVMSEKALYDKYKKKEAIISDPRMKIEMEVLELLEGLGFPMDEIGTYFYKDLIARIVAILVGDLADRPQIEAALEDPYSQLYFDVARNELDIGIKSFKEFVSLAFAKIDITNADPELLDSVIARMEDAVSNNQLPLVIAEHSRSLDLGQSRVRTCATVEDDTVGAN